jgi:hypothetical protein
VKQKQLSPTVTVTVAALVAVDWKARSEAIVATINAKPREEVFIPISIWLFSPMSCRRIAKQSVAIGNRGKVTKLLPSYFSRGPSCGTQAARLRGRVMLED